ncbi:MAG TPA: 5-formyltetrahydrofolate cyclo-ligase [Rhodanobacteraceae bacterium]|nr:5-formyltetrahydrofolate cyclo-ligase [Rhodanobacteraceae bacterium]
MSDDRTLLRARMSVRRNELDARQRVAAAAGVLHSLETLPEFMTDDCVAGYWAIRGELPLNLAVASLARRDQRYFLPVLRADRQLRFGEYATGTAISNNRYGIPEPDVVAAGLRQARDMDVILLPLLAFDRHGHRLGTGGGWYDRSLAFLQATERPAHPLLVGVGYAFQEAAAIPAEPWDVDLDYVATDAELIACHAPDPDA